MLQSIFRALFSCSHQHTTFPLTPARKSLAAAVPGGVRNGTYVVCLDCGQELAYDWNQMRIGLPVRKPLPATTAQPSYR